MAGIGKRKRKRNATSRASDGGEKRQKVSSVVNYHTNGKDPVIKQALLAQFYPQVFTLRQYLLARLPSASKTRRKKILSVGHTPQRGGEDQAEETLFKFLDQTLVGVSVCTEVSREERWRRWATFSQRADESMSTFINLTSPGVFSQSEVVDFAIWLLFSKGHVSNGKMQHLLCQGFRRDISSRATGRDLNQTSGIPGVMSTYPNNHVISMKSTPWPQVLLLMGKEGERAMIDIILDCGIFSEVGVGSGVYHQLSGTPLGELQVLTTKIDIEIPIAPKKGKAVVDRSGRTSSSIIFVRRRMMYARAAFNTRGGVRFGLGHVHVLNRFQIKPTDTTSTGYVEPITTRTSPDRNTVQVLMYIFPRQFGLHNVFTSDVDTRQTVQPFQDYTLREEEISKIYPLAIQPKVPKRLRHITIELVQKLQLQHSRLPYKELIEYYCPIMDTTLRFPTLPPQSENHSQTAEFQTQKSPKTPILLADMSTPAAIIPRQPSMMTRATPVSMVSAFCRAVLSRLIPQAFWGSGETQLHNEKTFLRNVDRFIKLRRFESLSLHDVTQGIQISNMEWLQIPNCRDGKTSNSDINKRWEILYEFIYYVFDSVLIPLIRGNFHVTESNVHRYRIFYFRHDVWRSLAEPAIASLKLAMFEEVKLVQARNLLASRKLGFSQIRLLPKETGVRPIMNLRRRPIEKNNMLGSSINSVLAPVYNVFTYEKTINPDRLQSTLFSVGDLYTKLKAFKSRIKGTSKPFYFAKVDVQAAFDTIPQAAVIKLMCTLPSESEYRIAKHVEIKPGENYREDLPGRGQSKPIRKWKSLARSPDDFDSFDENLKSDFAISRKDTIFVENVVSQFRDTDDLLDLLTEHIHRNMVKIGKKFYRQKEGIPQGSVMSSLLCNYFYADLEAQHLSFLKAEDSLLLRLIDDFLLITTKRSHAKQFIQLMHDGLPAYGVRVNPDKTLVNFEATINDKKVARLVGSNNFPYCGSFIDTRSLDITRDRERRKDIAIVDSLTVEFSRMPGKSFHRKVLNTFKIQSHAMFLDTSFNSLETVVSNVYTAFIETATKMWTYARCLPLGKQPGTKLLIKTISDLIDLAFLLMRSKSKNKKNVGFKCALSKVQVEWLALDSFEKVLKRKQSKYGRTIEWLKGRIERLKAKDRVSCNRVRRIIEHSSYSLRRDT